MRRRSGEDGAAVVELALVLPVFLGVLALIVPLALLLHGQLVVGSVAGEAVRFATSRADQPRWLDPAAGDDEGNRIAPGALPTEEQVEVEAQRAYGSGRVRLFLPTTARVAVQGSATATDTCPSGRRRTVDVEVDVNLGALAALVTGSTTKTVAGSATSCEE